MNPPDDRHIISEINSLLPKAMAAETRKAVRELGRLKTGSAKDRGKESRRSALQGLLSRIEASVREKEHRLSGLPSLTFDEALPITAKRDEIIDAIRTHPVLIVSGETGSGKTTQLPKFCLAAGRGIEGKIGCTQPRRIAATTVARRIAEELGEDLGRSVGYKIRFKDRTDPGGYIKIMTDGILLAETQGDPLLGEYDTLIVDEAHERSLNIDFILGILKNLLQRRNDLKLIITSATIDTEKFSAAFDDAPVLEVSGRMYPVQVRYFPADESAAENGEQTHVEMAVEAVDSLCREGAFGDILVFMPTEQDIRETCELIEGRKHMGVKVLPLFARLPGTEQTRVFSRIAARKIIVSTNVAETSLTIPGIRYVVDTGLARIPRYSPRTRTSSLPVVPISRSSADQRLGRCGRVANGVCIRLYSEQAYESRALYTPPEIVRSNLAEVILRMTALNLGDISDFAFIDRPSPKSIKDGYDLLVELGALVREESTGRKRRGPGYRLTTVGRLLARLPIDPRLSRMLIEARKEGCIESLTVITAALSLPDPRERPLDKAAAADRAHAEFKDPASDFITLLNLWNRYHLALKELKNTHQMKRYCRERFLSFKRMREWQDICAQIGAVLKENRFRPREASSATAGGAAAGVVPSSQATAEDGFGAAYGAIHRSILSGLLSNIAVKKEKNIFNATKGREVMVFPGSGLFNRAGAWIVAAEMVETSRLFARCAANIDPGWLEALAGDLCRSTYSSPRWERRRGQVVATEQVSLFGLVIVPERTVAYAPIDSKAAGEIFIRSALIEGDVRQPLDFMIYNRKEIEAVLSLENKVRRREFLVGEEDLADFYRQRLDGCCDWRTLEHLVRKKGDRFLRLRRDDLLRCTPDADELALFPDRIDLGVDRFECTYRFEPGSPEDGITVKIPEPVAPAVPEEAIDWLVPGLLREKILALIRGLPKTYRKQLVPVAETVDVIIEEMPRSTGALISALGSFIYRRFRVNIPASAWTAESLPEHLQLRVAITMPSGGEIRAARGRAGLQRTGAERGSDPPPGATRAKWEKTGITAWNFGDLPEIVRPDSRESSIWGAYPGLAPAADGQSVDLKLFSSREVARATHRKGVMTLYVHRFSKELKFLKKRLILADKAPSVAFGGAKVLEAALYQGVICDLFARDIRSQADFDAHAEASASRILARGGEWLDGLTRLLEAHQAAAQTLEGMARAHRFEPGFRQFISDRGADLSRLLPKNFLELYLPERFGDLARYIRALVVRAERGVIDLEKDSVKQKQVTAAGDHLQRMIEGLSPEVSAEKRTAVEEFHWLVEEFKVSVFAQELGTASPVSAKRLRQRAGEIEGMI